MDVIEPESAEVLCKSVATEGIYTFLAKFDFGDDDTEFLTGMYSKGHNSVYNLDTWENVERATNSYESLCSDPKLRVRSNTVVVSTDYLDLDFEPNPK